MTALLLACASGPGSGVDTVTPPLDPSAPLDATALQQAEWTSYDLATADVDGDGAVDLLRLDGAVTHVHFGPLTGAPDTWATATLGVSGHTWGVVDVDGDGRDDVLVGDETHNGSAGRVGLARSAGRAFELGGTWSAGDSQGPHGGTYLGFEVDSAGDQDGDGLDDLLMSAPIAQPAVYLLPGTAPSGDARDLAILTVTGELFTGVPITSGDLDGDGLAEVVVAGGGVVAVFANGTQGTLPVDDADALYRVESPQVLVQAGPGGAPELWILDDQALGRHDQPLDPSVEPVGVWRSEHAFFAASVQALGDVNQDGRAEVACWDGTGGTWVLETVEGQWDAEADALAHMVGTEHLVATDTPGVLIGADLDTLTVWSLD